MRCALSDHLSITPLGIPHRNEFADTVGYIVHGQQHNLLYIPGLYLGKEEEEEEKSSFFFFHLHPIQILIHGMHGALPWLQPCVK